MKPSQRTLTVPVSRAFLAALALALVSGLAGAPATAGIRDMVKSAKEKTVQKTGGKSAETPARPGAVPEFDDRVLELTEARIGQFLAGLKAGAAFTADLPKLVARSQALNEEIQKLDNTHGDAFRAYTQKRDANQDCFTAALEQSRDKRQEEMSRQLQSNPAQMRKITELAVRMNDAQMKGDTASVRRLTAETEAMFGATHEDSIAARRSCGAPPPTPPGFSRMEGAQSELGAVDGRIRDMNNKVRDVQLDASDMTRDQWAIAYDRVTYYLAAVKSKATPQGFSPTELGALAANQSALAAALGS